MKDKADLWMLPEEMLTMQLAVVKVEADTGAKTVNTEQEYELVGEEEMVLRMVEDDGTTMSKFSVNCEEISFIPEIPLGIKTDGGKKKGLVTK